MLTLCKAIVFAFMLALAPFSVGGAQTSAPQFRTRSDPQYSAWLAESQRSIRAMGPRALIGGAALGPIFYHEIGHEFDRLYGRPFGMDAEDFADQFALRILAMDVEAAPGGGVRAGLGFAASMVEFIEKAPTGHFFLRSDVQQIQRRQRMYYCAVAGEFKTFADAVDPLDYRFGDFGFAYPPEVVKAMKTVASIGGVPRPTYVRELLQAQKETGSYLNAELSPQLDAIGVSTSMCAANNRRLVQHMRGVLNNTKRFEALARLQDGTSGELLRRAATSTAFEFEPPQSPGARLVFYEFAPDGLAMQSNYGALLHAGWFSRDTNVVVRLRYCGLGFANAQISHAGGRTIVTVCYELGELIADYLPRIDMSIFDPDQNGLDPYVRDHYGQAGQERLDKRHAVQR